MATNRNIPNKIVFRAFDTSASTFHRLRNDQRNIWFASGYKARWALTALSTSGSHIAHLADRNEHRSASVRYYGTVLPSERVKGTRCRTLSTSTVAKAPETPIKPHTRETETFESFSEVNPFFPYSEHMSHTPTERLSGRENSVSRLEDNIPGSGKHVKSFEPELPLSTWSKPDDIVAIPPYLTPEQDVPPSTPHEDFRYIVRRKDYGKNRRFVTRHDYLYNHIISLRDRFDIGTMKEAVETILKPYVDSKAQADWRLVQELYTSLCHHLPTNCLHNIRQSLIKVMLQDSRIESNAMFFTVIESDRLLSDRHVQTYLKSFCEENSDPSSQLAEARKVLDAAREASVSLSTKAALPLVREALSAGDSDRAHRLIEQLSTEYDLSTNFAVLNELVKSYAREGNWSALDDLYAQLHEDGYPRSKPTQFAALVRTHYHFFTMTNPPERAYDLLTYIMQNYGLIPTASLSVNVIKTYVLAKRYDMLQKWVIERRIQYPSSLSPVSSPLAAYEIVNAWSLSAATSSDVLSTCKALAYDAVRDPFSDELRQATNNYLVSYIKKQISELTHSVGLGKHINIGVKFKTFKTLGHAINVSQNLIPIMQRRRLSTREAVLLSAFSEHIAAARQLNSLLNSFDEYIQQYGMVIGSTHGGTQDISYLHKRAPTTGLPKYKVPLPPDHILAMTGLKLVEAVRQVSQEYEDRTGQPGYRVAIRVMEYLREQLRPRDCSYLVADTWKLGISMDAWNIQEIIQIWLHTARELHDLDLLHRALWAAIDAEERWYLNSRVLLLIRIAVSNLRHDVEVMKIGSYQPNQVEELDYLISRLYRRKWQQEGYPEAEDITHREMKAWKEAEDMEILVPELRKAYSRDFSVLEDFPTQ